MKDGEKNGYLFSLFVGLGMLSFVSFLVTPKFAAAAYQIPDFYFYYSEKIYLNLSKELITVSFEESVSKEKKQSLIIADPVLKSISTEKLSFGLVLVVTNDGLQREEVTEAVERLNKLAEVKYCTPVFEFRNVKIVLVDEFVVKFKPDITEEDIRVLNEEHGVAVVRKSPYRHNRYILRVMNPKDKNAIEIANIYNETQWVEYGTPSFLVIGGYCSTYPDDTYGPKPAPDGGEQWHLHNIGQVPPGGTANADIDAPEGWDISTGSSNIVIEKWGQSPIFRI